MNNQECTYFGILVTFTSLSLLCPTAFPVGQVEEAVICYQPGAR